MGGHAPWYPGAVIFFLRQRKLLFVRKHKSSPPPILRMLVVPITVINTSLLAQIRMGNNKYFVSSLFKDSVIKNAKWSPSLVKRVFFMYPTAPVCVVPHAYILPTSQTNSAL